MTKYSEIAELPDGNIIFIHYEQHSHPLWIEYLDKKTNKSLRLAERRTLRRLNIRNSKTFKRCRLCRV